LHEEEKCKVRKSKKRKISKERRREKGRTRSQRSPKPQELVSIAKRLEWWKEKCKKTDQKKKSSRVQNKRRTRRSFRPVESRIAYL
jgi:hypothetical protein